MSDQQDTTCETHLPLEVGTVPVADFGRDHLAVLLYIEDRVTNHGGRASRGAFIGGSIGGGSVVDEDDPRMRTFNFRPGAKVYRTRLRHGREHPDLRHDD